MNQITFIPVGGLANRMRSIASVTALAQHSESQVNITWFQDWALRSPFKNLFESILINNINLEESNFFDSILLDRPRNKNLYIPRLYQLLRYKSAIYERSYYDLIQQNFDFIHWIKEYKNVYMASYSIFYPYPHTLINELFIPNKQIQQGIDFRCKNFHDNVIGVHIRRTDNIASIQNSPIELFFKRIDTNIDMISNTQIYLATDSEDVKQSMKNRYGNRVITSERAADRNSTQGIQDGVIDMYTLARTSKIYGSFQSSFSEMASQIGNIPLEIIQGKEA